MSLRKNAKTCLKSRAHEAREKTRSSCTERATP